MFLERLNKLVRGWAAGIILALVAITFVFFGSTNFFEYKPDSAVAWVNGDAISLREFENTYEQMRSSRPALASSAPFLKQLALDRLVTIALLTQDANHLGLTVSDETVMNYLKSIPELQEQGQFSVPRFQAWLKTMGLRQENILQYIRSDLKIEEMRYGLARTEFVLPLELNQEKALLDAERSFDYWVIQKNNLASRVHINDPEIEAYYRRHQTQFKIPEQVDIQYIDLSYDAIKASIHPSEQELKQYYHDHPTEFTQPVAWKIAQIVLDNKEKKTELDKKKQQIQTKLRSGVDFLTLVKKYSIDPLSSGRYAVSEWILPGQWDPNLEKILLTLNQVGAYSNWVKLDQGEVLIKLIDHRKAKVLPFNEVRRRVEEKVTIQQSQKLFLEKVEHLTHWAYTHPDSLSDSATALDLPIKATGFLTREFQQTPNKQNLGISSDPAFLKAAFSSEVLHDGLNSEPISLSSQHVVVLRRKQYLPQHIKPLSEVRHSILNTLTQQALSREAENLGQVWLAQMKQNKDVKKKALPLGLKWKSIPPLKRDDQKAAVPSAILHAAFDYPFSPNDPYPQWTATKLDNGDYAVIWVRSARLGQQVKMSQTEKDKLYREISSDLAYLDYEFYMDDLKKKAKIEKNDSILINDSGRE